MLQPPLFSRVAVIGIGLIGSSLALAMRRAGLADTYSCGDASQKHVNMALELELVDKATTDNLAAIQDADLVILSTPVGAYPTIAQAIGPHLKPGCMVMDVGSVKQAAIAAIAPHIPAHAHYVPAHPIAGTEESGPEAGFAELFDNRWCLLTPMPETAPEACEKIAELWRRCGAKVETMGPEHHDLALAMISHFPHCVAFTAIGTANRLAQDLGKEVLCYAGSSFRDMVRVAASDPIMWRDIFLNNRQAVLEILSRFRKDLDALEQEIAESNGPALEERFAQNREIRRTMGEKRQIEPPPVTKKS